MCRGKVANRVRLESLTYGGKLTNLTAIVMFPLWKSTFYSRSDRAIPRRFEAIDSPQARE
jgi:hypothetical protein